MLEKVIVGSWMIAHAFIWPAAIFRTSSQKKIFSIFGFSFIGIALALKPNTYDLIAYLEYFGAPFPTDIGFYLISVALTSIGLAPTIILIFYQVLISVILYFITRIIVPKKDLFPALFLVFGSIFFILATQNILRQGLSVSIAMLAYTALVSKNRRFFASICLFAISISIHIWSVIIIILMALEFFVNSFGSNHKINLYNLFIGFLFGLISLLVVDKLGASEVYLDSNFNWEGNRTSIILKLAIYFLTFVFMHFLINNIFKDGFFFRRIYSLRVLIFSFSLPLSVYGEIFSRVQVFFYSFEALIIIGLYCSNTSKANLALAIFAITYALAPNVINILTSASI